MAVTTESIRLLRERTGAGIMDSKRALEASDGDVAKAEIALREKGLARAASKADRSTGEGVVECYVHSGGRIGAMVELNCETDFVARTEEFSALAHNIAMQVAAMNPVFIDREELPADYPREAEEVCLMEQSFIKDSGTTIKDLVMDIRARVGENVRIKRFSRFGLGE